MRNFLARRRAARTAELERVRLLDRMARLHSYRPLLSD